MPKRIKPNGKQKTYLVIHAIAFAIGVTIMWSTYAIGVKGWPYPWPAWITAAWAFWLVGHACVVFTSYQDKGLIEYKHMESGV